MLNLPMDTELFNKYLQQILGNCEDLQLETYSISDIDCERGYSEDDKIAENIYRYCGDSTRFQITVTQLES